MRTEVITSAQNPKIRRLLALQQKSSERRDSGLFVLEGVRETVRCLSAGYEADSLFVCPEILADVAAVRGLAGSVPPGRVFEVTKELYSKIAYRGGTEGLIAEVRTKECTLDMLQLPDNPLVLVTESVEKPGNVGAMLRSCDAAGADAMIICGSSHTDLYNPNVIRASTGALFSVPLAEAENQEAYDWLKRNGIRTLAATPHTDTIYTDVDMTRSIAIVVGTEQTGLTELWMNHSDLPVRIPMLGKIDSLNVATATTILLYEAARQRNWKR